MPEKPNRLKLVVLFSAFALPAVILTTTAWVLSVNTPYFKTAGQILLLLITSIPFLIASGYLTLSYINKKYLKPMELIIQVLKSINTQSFKPLPKNTKLEGYLGIYEQLTQLHQAFSKDNQSVLSLKTAAQAQVNLFQTGISEVTDPIIVLNSKMEVSLINFASETVTGVRRMDVIGKKIDQFVRLYDKNNKEITPLQYAPSQRPGQNPKVFTGQEVKVISCLNWQSYANVTVFKPELSEQIDISCVILLHDKSKEKQLEAMKLDFVSMAAHELRTPLTSIKGYISVFLNENQSKLTADQLMFIRRINTSTQQLTGLVENLLSVARVERGALNLHNQIIDWVANVAQQVDTFQHRADEKRITLRFIKPGKSLPKVDVDLIRINEVLNNIISNALSYTEPQGKIDVWIEQKDEQILTFIKDTGKGIPKEAIPNLFSKFFRVQGGPAEQASKGNGLGLYLSKAIIELHHGKIWAQSEGLGKGSIFAFSLPAVKESFDINLLTKTI